MFDVGFSELVLLFVIGLLILGPERLPRVASQLGRWMGKARRTAHQLRMQIEREMTMNDIMRDQKKREEENKASAPGSGEAEQAEGETYPEDEDANESGHRDAGTQTPADEPSDTAAAPGPAGDDARPDSAKDDESKEQRLA